MNKGPKLQRISKHVWILPFNSPKDRPNLGYILGGEKALAVDAGHSSSHVEDFYNAIRTTLLACTLYTAKLSQGLKRAINWRRSRQKWTQTRTKPSVF